MRESRTYGFVRGVPGDRHPYRDSQQFCVELSLTVIERRTPAVFAQSPNLAAVGIDRPVSAPGPFRNIVARMAGSRPRRHAVSVSRF